MAIIAEEIEGDKFRIKFTCEACGSTWVEEMWASEEPLVLRCPKCG